MKRLLLFLGVGVLVVSVGWGGVNYIQQQTTLKKQTQKLQKIMQEKEWLEGQQASFEQQLDSAKNRLKEQEKQQENIQTIQNNDSTSEVRQVFSKRVTQLFEEMFNFSPENYGERKEKVKDLLSSGLLKTYFSDSQTIGDSNGVYSSLISCEVYSKAINGEKIDGIVVVKYSSGTVKEQNKALNIFSVTYDSNRQVVTDIQNLGSGYTGDLIDD